MSINTSAQDMMTHSTQTTQEAPTLPSSRAGLVASTAAGLSLLAALIHLWAAPEHFEKWWGHGMFFVVAAGCQGLFAVTVMRWYSSRPILLAGVVGNLVIVVLYIVSYTWGMPFGADWTLFSPSVAHLQDPDALGMLATASELGIIAGAVFLLDGGTRRLVLNLLLLAGGGLWALRIFGILP